MSFQQGLSGLNASAKNLDVISNNIANANTYGAKFSRVEFADVYAATPAANAGMGVSISAVSQQFTQGSITNTGRPLDIAISGGGFFQLMDQQNDITYSRNGQLTVDKSGQIVNSQGARLVGYLADIQGNIQPGNPQALVLPTVGITPEPTTEIGTEMNLDSRLAITLPTAGPQLIVTDPATYNNATSMTVYDMKGQEVALTYYFQKSAPDEWNVYMSANGVSLQVDGAGDPMPVTTVQFSPDGSAPTSPVGPVLIDIPGTVTSNGALTEPILGVALNLNSTTQYGSLFGVTSLAQDGYAAGQLINVIIEESGVLMARYSNGQSKPAGQVELANFRSPNGLEPLGGNAWARSFASGAPLTGVPGSGNLGLLQSSALEESNVDLTAELVNLITAQRVYQANAQSIKTQDQSLQTLVNLR
ncbi:MAG: flagellar hook protein FlgE [Burkholderiaceae bacterium]|nr:flagellar hook protein FlgE [Burkholderiaceae bacterium]MDH3459376.1 flagellar hook protein FlgE [Burkholderiaceae bacterium]